MFFDWEITYYVAFMILRTIEFTGLPGGYFQCKYASRTTGSLEEALIDTFNTTRLTGHVKLTSRFIAGRKSPVRFSMKPVVLLQLPVMNNTHILVCFLNSGHPVLRYMYIERITM